MELLAGYRLSWQRHCVCVCVSARMSLLWCEEHFSNHDPIPLSNWIKCNFQLCRERDKNVCDWQYIKPLVRFRKTLTLGALSSLHHGALSPSLFHDNRRRRWAPPPPLKFSSYRLNSADEHGSRLSPRLIVFSPLSHYIHQHHRKTLEVFSKGRQVLTGEC